METGKLKKFATEARANLMNGVKLKLRYLGFDSKGNFEEKDVPQLVEGATLWNKQEYPESFYGQWTALRDRIASHGIKEVVEEAAYTWFNRLMAIRILTMNRLCDEILTFDASAGMPKLLANARLGMIPDMDAQQERHLRKLMEDDNLVSEQFAAVLSAWCHNNPIIRACFGSISDYVELLLPANITQEGGFLSLLNDTAFITEEDYRSAELIGWLYQFYISDRKDEVFAKKGKVEADEIPAATQIFTPNWIVKYMVENTIIPQVDAPDEIIEGAKYLVKESAQCDHKVELEDLKVADLACGSGHILNECFNLLFDLYRKEAYSRHEAIEEIFSKNLLGIDLDLRAKQLATFSLLLKACIWGRDIDDPDTYFADAHCLPKVLTIPELANEMLSGDEEMIAAYLHHFFLGSETKDARDELVEAIKLVKDAPSLGSIIKFNLSSSTRRQLSETVAHWRNQTHLAKAIEEGLPVMDFILALTDSYDAIVMNPPYMGSGRFDDVLSKYVAGGGKGKDKIEAKYPDSKADLFAIFMDVAYDRLKEGGRYGMINMQSWMFLSSFENLREKIIKNQKICSLLHLGPHTFDELSGEVVQNVAFVIEKNLNYLYGDYFRLIEGRNCSVKERLFLANININNSNIRYNRVNQLIFIDIPNYALSYWMTPALLALNDHPTLGSIADLRSGISTGNNTLFYRLWFECDCNKISDSYELTPFNSDFKWFKIIRGGTARKWYGNCDNVINLENKCNDIKYSGLNHRLRTPTFYNKLGITWSRIASSKLAFRLKGKEVNFGENSPCMFFTSEEEISFILGLVNSSLISFLLTSINPTLSFQLADVTKAPILFPPNKDIINDLVDDNIQISKFDWDVHETSWDFQQNPLISEISYLPKEMIIFKDEREQDFEILYPEYVRCDANLEERLVSKTLSPSSIQDCYLAYRKYWTEKFRQLHQNEEKINKEFIDIYGLQDELNPDVDLQEITILQQGEISIDGDDVDGTVLIWHSDVIIKQLISYIVGVWMGRYRLDRPGLNIAHPNPSADELSKYQIPNINSKMLNDNCYLVIDQDAIIPVLPKDAPFPDNLENYIEKFVRTVFGEESANENLNFIEKCLGKSIGAYLDKDFWKDHKKMYQNRPIYWLFSSKKGAFKAIVYVHRMDKYTVEQVRAKYLLPYIGYMERQIESLEKREGSLSTAERKELDRRRADLADMREYHDRLQQRAAEVAAWPSFIDLDDGIIANHARFGDILTKLK